MPRRKTVEELKAQLEDLDRKAREKKAALKDKLRRVEAAHKRTERKKDTRRKILLGAMVLDRMDKDAEYRRRTMAMLDKKLTRPHDRELFDLPPLPDSENS